LIIRYHQSWPIRTPMATQVSSGPNQSLQAVIQGSFDVSEQALITVLSVLPMKRSV